MRKASEKRAWAGQEQVYHAALCCQAASLSLTAQHLHGQNKACPAKGKKQRGSAAFCQYEWSVTPSRLSQAARLA